MNSDLNGIVLLDKPAGLSSAQAVARVKKIMGAAKCGHSGTLDPFATGVLICCVNQATRLARFFLQGEKQYQAVLRLGICTETQDATGRVMASSCVPQFAVPEIEAVFKSFEGLQLQEPPIYAALKHNGTPLYRLARQGRPIQKPARPVTIRYLRIQAIRLPDIHFDVTCSAGTYIRTLCADIGRRLDCGGHLAQLRRTASSGFTILETTTLADLQEMADQGRTGQALIAMADALRKMPAITADGATVEHIRQGRRLTSTQVPAEGCANWDSEPAHNYLKVVDDRNQLKAVVQKALDGMSYNYCCVFN